MRNPERVSHVGIYAGTFDPVHEGHLAFAKEAIESCGVDKVFFLVEPRPRRKQGVRALEHREVMVRIAIQNEPRFGMIVLEQINFSVEETLPKLQALFEGAKLFMLMGEDVFTHLNGWPHVTDLLKASSFIVGIREGDEAKMNRLLHTVEKTRGIKFDASFLVTQHHTLSSSKIRLAIKRGHEPLGLQGEVINYIRKNNLYAANEG